MNTLHTLLARQIKRHFGTLEQVPEKYLSFVREVSEAYREFEIESGMLERALEISSEEHMQANAQMRALLEAFPDLYFRLNAQGHILEYRAGSTADAFLPPHGLEGKLIQAVPRPDIARKFQEAIEQVGRNRSLVVIEYDMKLRADNEYYEARLLPLPNDEIFVIVRNITARKLAERQLATAFDELESRVLERTQELNQAKLAAEAASRAKSRFLAVMSHEMRTPLNGVTGMLQLLLPDHPTPQQRRWMDMAQSSANTLLRVIEDVLDFSKVEAGKLDLRMTPTHLPSAIQKTVAPFAHKAADKVLAWKCEIDPAIPPFVETDADRLAQMLVNLLGNAVKFTDAGGVCLRVRLKSETPEEATVRFEVTDTGEGMSPEQQKALFKPFSQVDNSSTRRHGGTGLGLGICKHLAELMGGVIGVETSLGQGSNFWFELPFKKTNSAPAAANRDRAAAKPATQPASVRVLLAEDNEINQELAREIIEFAGGECTCVLNGREAVWAAANCRYDLIFMDCMMPEMDGYAATQAIRAKETSRAAAGQPNRRVPIIAMTANAMTGDREECLAAGMDDYLTKPLDPDKVANAIQRWSVDGSLEELAAKDENETPITAVIKETIIGAKEK